jgi:tyrosinase
MRFRKVFLLPFVAKAGQQELEDSSSLLSLHRSELDEGLSSTSMLLMAAGRNISHVSALVEELARDSVQGNGVKLDEDVQTALTTIQDVMVVSIRNALLDAHKVDQAAVVDQLQCFANCQVTSCSWHRNSMYRLRGEHRACRTRVRLQYMVKTEECNKLDEWVKDWKMEDCKGGQCLYLDPNVCHEHSPPEIVAPKAEMGGWLKDTAAWFREQHHRWVTLHNKCAQAYKEYIELDASCDMTQRNFEQTTCQYGQCEHSACTVQYTSCRAQCIQQYHKIVDNTQCLEKDRKIDWSSTEKIECYIKVLLASPSKTELIKACGTDDCLNKYREQEYKNCDKICEQVDVNTGTFASHERREAINGSQLVRQLGDIDVDGDNHPGVNTTHRLANAADEHRCTSHLDIDYQAIPCAERCRAPPPMPCSRQFERLYYRAFDKKDILEGFDIYETCYDDEHTEKWAYNRCPCTSCPSLIGGSSIENDDYCPGGSRWTPPSGYGPSPPAPMNYVEPPGYETEYDTPYDHPYDEDAEDEPKPTHDGTLITAAGHSYRMPPWMDFNFAQHLAPGPDIVEPKVNGHPTLILKGECKAGKLTVTPPSLSGGCQRCTCVKGKWQCACSLRVRKEIHDMTDSEWDKFAEAVNRLKLDGTWKQITEVHVQSMSQVHVSHNSPIFLPWHRKFQMEIENRLQMAMNDCSITIPYWNWALELPTFHKSEVWSKKRFGSLNRYKRAWSARSADRLCVKDGAFGTRTEGSEFGQAAAELGEDFVAKSDCIMRSGGRMANMPYTEIMSHLQQKEMNMTMFDYMTWFLEFNVHNSFHTAVGGTGRVPGHMSTMSSPYDPVFYLHHGFIDHLFQKWQDIHLTESDRWAHRHHDRMSNLLFDGETSSFPVIDVMHSMDILDDDPATPDFKEKACVVYNERMKSEHACDENWDRIQECLVKVFDQGRLGQVPRIKHMTTLGDVCSPLNPIESDLNRMWLENMAHMGMMEESKVHEILAWEHATNKLADSLTESLNITEATECDKTLCFSTTKLLEICGY